MTVKQHQILGSKLDDFLINKNIITMGLVYFHNRIINKNLNQLTILSTNNIANRVDLSKKHLPENKK